MKSFISEISRWATYNKPLIEFIGAAVGVTAAIITLLYNTTRRNSLDKKRSALEIMKGWNENTIKTTSKIREKYEENYKNCQKIELSSLNEYINKYPELSDNIIYLFNYFEFIATSCKHKAVNQQMINDAFSVSMFRYTALLEEYLLNDFEKSKRNHWKPFTGYIEMLIRNNKIKCNKECDNCPKKKDSKFYESLKILNS